MEHSNDLSEIAAALVKFQGQVTGAAKGGENPHFRSQYTRLEDAWSAARDPLADAGLSVTQWPATDDQGCVTVTTMVMHASGQWIRGDLRLSPTKRDPQGVGSAITYACRYAFLAALGLPPTDDDGNAASAPNGNGTTKPPHRQPQAKNEDIAGKVRAAKSWSEVQALKPDVQKLPKGSADRAEAINAIREAMNKWPEESAAAKKADEEAA